MLSLAVGGSALLLSAGAHAASYIVTDLGPLGSGDSFGTAINDAGQVTGNGQPPCHGYCSYAFLYSGGVMTSLGVPLSGGTGINDAGQVTGTAGGPAYQNAFLYSGGVTTDLGTLGGPQSYGDGINDAGQVTGTSDIVPGRYNSGHAFLYSGGVMTDLGTLGGPNSSGSAINNAGQVTGYSDTAGFDGHAFLYSGGVMTDLNSLIDPASGWILQDATGINNAGQITGFGLIGGHYHAFLLAPQAAAAAPEPATWAMMLLGFGGLGIALRSRRRQSAIGSAA
jgi:probable HAF family extracellular repeat protein